MAVPSRARAETAVVSHKITKIFCTTTYRIFKNKNESRLKNKYESCDLLVDAREVDAEMYGSRVRICVLKTGVSDEPEAFFNFFWPQKARGVIVRRKKKSTFADQNQT